MKILGFAMIIFSCLICGYYYADRKNERLKELSSLCTMLEMMQGELGSRLSPLPDMVRQLSSRLSGKAAVFLTALSVRLGQLGEKDLMSLWSESCSESLDLLEEGERKMFCELASVLGKYDVERQNAALQECIQCFRESLRRESFEFPQLKKLSMGLSVSAGALLAILLV